MVQLLALARDGHRIELVDLTAGSRRVILTDTGWHPDGIACDGSTIYWTTMGQHTGTNAFGEGIYGDVDGGVHAIDVDGTNRRDIVPTGGTTTGKQLALDSDGNLYWGNREGFALTTARTDIELLWDDLPAPIDVELDDGRLFWTDRGRQPGGDSLNRAAVPPLGHKGEAPQLLADDFQDPIGLAVDGKDKLAYVADLGGRIWVVPGPGHPEMTTHIAIDLGFPLTGLNLIPNA